MACTCDTKTPREKNPTKALTSAERKKLVGRVARREFQRTMERLDAEAAAARVEARAKLAKARSDCKANAVRVREESAAAYARAKELAREARDLERQSAKFECQADVDGVRSERAAKLEEVKAKKAEERRFARELARIEKRAAASKPPRGGIHSVMESDDDVRQNITSDLVPLWERVKRSIKGSPRRTRTEAFYEYVEEHADEVSEARALEEPSDDDLAAAAQRHYEEHARMSNPSPISLEEAAAIVKEEAKRTNVPAKLGTSDGGPVLVTAEGEYRDHILPKHLASREAFRSFVADILDSFE